MLSLNININRIKLNSIHVEGAVASSSLSGVKLAKKLHQDNQKNFVVVDTNNKYKIKTIQRRQTINSPQLTLSEALQSVKMSPLASMSVALARTTGAELLNSAVKRNHQTTSTIKSAAKGHLGKTGGVGGSKQIVEAAALRLLAAAAGSYQNANNDINTKGNSNNKFVSSHRHSNGGLLAKSPMQSSSTSSSTSSMLTQLSQSLIANAVSHLLNYTSSQQQLQHIASSQSWPPKILANPFVQSLASSLSSVLSDGGGRHQHHNQNHQLNSEGSVIHAIALPAPQTSGDTDNDTELVLPQSGHDTTNHHHSHHHIGSNSPASSFLATAADFLSGASSSNTISQASGIQSTETNNNDNHNNLQSAISLLQTNNNNNKPQSHKQTSPAVLNFVNLARYVLCKYHIIVHF